jgi:hypothetical protein
LYPTGLEHRVGDLKLFEPITMCLLVALRDHEEHFPSLFVAAPSGGSASAEQADPPGRRVIVVADLASLRGPARGAAVTTARTGATAT